MIESIMYFAAGFLAASLLALALVSSVHHRAVRLTQRRLQDSIPVSLNEIQADRDKLRARFAMSTRRLETTIAQLEAKSASQQCEIARRSEAIAKLKAQLADKDSVTDDLSGKLKVLATDTQMTELDRAELSAAAKASAKELAQKDHELAEKASEATELNFANETQRVEIVMLRAQVERFHARIEELESDGAGSRRGDGAAFAREPSAADRGAARDREAHDALRAENEFLRERIADIAARVAHLSMNDAASPVASMIREATAGIRAAPPAGPPAVPAAAPLGAAPAAPSGAVPGPAPGPAPGAAASAGHDRSNDRVNGSEAGPPPGGGLVERIRKLEKASSPAFPASS